METQTYQVFTNSHLALACPRGMGGGPGEVQRKVKTPCVEGGGGPDTHARNLAHIYLTTAPYLSHCLHIRSLLS